MQDSEEDSAQEDIIPKSKRTKKAYKQKYNRAWETDPLLKGWISAVKTDPYPKPFVNLVAKSWWQGFLSLRSTLLSRNIRKTCCLFQKLDLFLKCSLKTAILIE